MLRFDLASIDGQAECSRTDAKQVSGFRQIHPSFRLAPITIVARDLMMRAKRRHSFPGPAIPVSGQPPAPVERIRQQVIRTDGRQCAHGLNDL